MHKNEKGLNSGPARLPAHSPARGRKKWRVGKLAHDSLRSRCPRAAPNPFFRDYACVLGRPMGQRSHETGYVGCSTADPFLAWLTTLHGK
jgi:hypothetical protein